MFILKTHPDVIGEWKDNLYRFAQYRNELVEVLHWFGETAVEFMKDGHPPGGPHPAGKDLPVYGENRYIDDTGWLTDSIGYTIEPYHTWTPGEGLASALPTLRVFATAPYASAIEFGVPGHARPYPFFWPTIELLLPEASAKIAAVMEQLNQFRAK